jgi:hypothetical protein
MPDFGLARLASCFVVAVALALSGCSAGDFELNGKIFDVLGVSSASQTPQKEPRLAARPGLVLPPNPDALPDPSSVPPPVAAVDNPSWPKDADDARRVATSDSARKQEEFCKKDGNWREKSMRDEVGSTSGPGGNCSGNLFSAIFSKGASSDK